jgi:hypothetical protein
VRRNRERFPFTPGQSIPASCTAAITFHPFEGLFQQLLEPMGDMPQALQKLLYQQQAALRIPIERIYSSEQPFSLD